MTERFPGYDVLAKRDGPSWNEQTRRVIAERLAVPRGPRFLSADEFATLEAIAARVVPQPAGRPEVPVAALVEEKLVRDEGDGYRAEHMPRHRDAWKRGLAALDAEAEQAHGRAFRALSPGQQDELLQKAQAGELKGSAWGGMPSDTFFSQRLLYDVVGAYWSHPTAWSEMGFGGPASPRGYVRMDYDELDPWEAAEARPGEAEAALRHNRHVR